MDRGYDVIRSLQAQLKRETGVRQNIPDLLALASKNDPFYAGAPASQRDATWFAQLWADFRFSRGTHLRRVHYRLVSEEKPPKKPGDKPYENMLKCWGFLSEAGKQARYRCLVEADAFEDHRNPPSQLHMVRELFRPQRGMELSWVEAWTLLRIESDLRALLDLSMPEVEEIHGYDYAPEDEPYLVEVWIEKPTVGILAAGVRPAGPDQANTTGVDQEPGERSGATAAVDERSSRRRASAPQNSDQRDRSTPPEL
jgi:hypothetical protein